MYVFRYSLTLQQAGLFTSIFTVIPSIVKITQILFRFRTEGNQIIINLGNWFVRRNHKNIGNWFAKNQYVLERIFNASILFIATLAFFAGLLMQLLATCSNAK